ncbi:unnamed protein product [Protopolystoma xenopodis]|uniref:Uncharacterized protein n=1 Tax=Protopolystoma xenopodis TaxID=117903 RepID=A0A3S5CR10_9PLAT|nr:unnamed protein product [Protopolystoma xenopodis]
MPRVPGDLPVLIVANHRDMGHHRTLTASEVKAFLASEADASRDSP